MDDNFWNWIPNYIRHFSLIWWWRKLWPTDILDEREKCRTSQRFSNWLAWRILLRSIKYAVMTWEFLQSISTNVNLLTRTFGYYIVWLVKRPQNPIILRKYPGWSPRDNQSWTALFQRFDIFQCWSENLKNISTDQLCFRADHLWFSLNQRCCSQLKKSALLQKESALFSADFLSSETLGFQRWTALIQRWFTPNLLWY